MTYVRLSTRGILEAPFHLDSVAEAPAPQGQGGVWQRYVITQGANKIVGMRAGMRGEVDVIVGRFVDGLNARFAKQQSKLRR